jgi:SHOCT-like domain
MTSVEERLRILKMVEDGKISAEDGAKLLAALAESRKPPPPPPPPPGGTPDARWFRVRVTDTRTNRPKINVNIPAGLVNVGIRMGARFAPNLEADQMQAMIDALKSGARGKILDVTEDEAGEHVEIFVE